MRPEHRLLRALAGLLVGALVGGALSCLGTSVFRCDDDAACDLRAGGRCEGDRHCSYPDDTCPLGRRYADAGALGEACVGAAAGSTDATTEASTTGDASTATTDDTDTSADPTETTGSGLGATAASAGWHGGRPVR